MKQFRADLHCHTICSDGSLSPKEILDLAKESGLGGLCITDHDSIEAYATALPYAEQIGIEMIPGAEFSAIQDDISVHILGYSFCLDNLILQDFFKRHKKRREQRNRAMLERLALHNMPVTEQELDACLSSTISHATCSVGRPHIAQAMIKKGYVTTVSEAFKLYLGEGKLCYIRGETFTVQETIDVIHQAKGLAIIAHPHLIKEQRTVLQLLKMNFDGLEGYYAKFFPSQHERWIKIAERKGWLITGGSDYHGLIKPAIPLGCSWVNEEIFRMLHTHWHNANNITTSGIDS